MVLFSYSEIVCGFFFFVFFFFLFDISELITIYVKTLFFFFLTFHSSRLILRKLFILRNCYFIISFNLEWIWYRCGIWWCPFASLNIYLWAWNRLFSILCSCFVCLYFFEKDWPIKTTFVLNCKPLFVCLLKYGCINGETFTGQYPLMDDT